MSRVSGYHGPMIRLLQVLALVASTMPPPAFAAEYRTEGATIRLIAEPPDAAGRIRGAVLFGLDPGWKTYWLDPGESGLAPRLDFSGSRDVDDPRLSFPPPERLTANGEALNGYDAPMAIAFETTGKADGHLVLSFLAGVCRTLCVPVAATLHRDLAEPLSMADAMAIDRAFLSRPADGGAVAARIEGDTLLVEAPSEPAVPDDLFVAGSPGWRFGEPTAREGRVWHVPIRERPRDGRAPTVPFQAVFVGGDRAFSLTISLP